MQRNNQIRIISAVLLILAFTGLLFAFEAAGADLSARPAAELQQQWNRMMLEGRFGRLYNGQFYEFYQRGQRGASNSAIDPTTSFSDMAHGWVHDAYTPWESR